MVKEVSMIKEVCDSNGKMTIIIEWEKNNPTTGEYSLWFNDVILESESYTKITKTSCGDFCFHLGEYDRFGVLLDKDLVNEICSDEQKEYLNKYSVPHKFL
jgi:hypothetical protein